MKRSLPVLLIALLMHPATVPARGQTSPATRPGGIDIRRTPATKESPEIVAWTVTPQAPPTPALRYRLLPPREDLVSGNAASVYRIALLLHQPLNLKEAYPGRDIKEAPEYLEMPIADMPVRDASLLIGGSPLQHVDWAARRDRVEWDWPVREQGLATLLPELNGMRELGDRLRLRARIEILEGRYDDAFRTLQSGFALSRDIAHDAVLVNALVGAGIASNTMNQVRELAVAPDGPNLYWALADLPRPMFAIEQTMEQESAVLRASLPLLRDARGKRFPVEQWQQMWDELAQFAPSLSGERVPLLPAGADASPFARRFAAATLTAAALPRARQYLTRHGMTAQQIDALPAVQVVAIYFVEQYERQSHAFDRWLRLPFHVGYAGREREIEQFTATKRGEPLNPLLSLIPATPWVTLARVDREIAAMQTVEAVRAYAAANGGRLPGSLDQIIDTPAPPDPMSGEPFGYTVEGNNRFILTAPPVGGRKDRALRYEVTVRAR